MPKKRLKFGLLSGTILLLTASRPTKPNTTEVTAQGSTGQLEERELAGSKTFPGGGCNGGTVEVFRHYKEKQVGGTLGVVHTTASEKTVSAEVSAYDTTRVSATLLPGKRDIPMKEAEYSTRRDTGAVVRLGSTQKKAHWELGAGLYQVKDKSFIRPSGMVRLGSAGPAYAYADMFGSSIIPLGTYASTGLGFDFGNKGLEAKVGIGPSLGAGLEGDLPLGRRVRFKLGGMAYLDAAVYHRWQAYSGLTLIAGNGVGQKSSQAQAVPKNQEEPASPPPAPVKKKRWIEEKPSSPFLNY